jgi:predicted acyltransferase
MNSTPSGNPRKEEIPVRPVTKRILSLDALRGFTMFWIIGGGAFFIYLHEAWPNAFTKVLAENMEHAGWEGFYFMDLIFPLFLFLVGVLIPYTILGRIKRGVPRKTLYLHILKRTVVLILLGWVNYGILRFDFPNMRWSTVLGRIGLCYMAASFLVIHTSWRVQLGTIVVILLGYWAAAMFIPVPGYGAGVLTPEGSLMTWLDQQLIPGSLGLGLYDRQGVMSTFTALATTLMGVLAGHWLRSQRSEKEKVRGLLLAGIVTLFLGWLWGRFFFISRNVWTSSFTLYSGGMSILLLVLFYWVIDIRGYKRWTFFFVVIGMNAITIWVGQRLISFDFTAKALFEGVSKYMGVLQPVFLAAMVVMLKWLLLNFMYKRKIFLKA